MPPEIAGLIDRFGIGVITYDELVEGVFSYLVSHTESQQSILVLLRDLPDPLLSELPEHLVQIVRHRH